MPRKIKITAELAEFLKENAHKGGNWLAQETGIDRAFIYQYGSDNGISFKDKTKISSKQRKLQGLKGRNKMKWPRPYRRQKAFIIKRDGLNCHYCGRELTIAEVQIDHVIPQVRGGSDSPDNLVVSCSRCNNLKGSCCYSCPEFRNSINATRR